MGPAYLTQPTIQRIPILLEEIRQGRLRVPRFQRAFVWSAQQRIDLMVSILEGWPIGSLLFWRTRHHHIECYVWRGPVPTEPISGDGAPDQTVEYVLDGHQRLTTLYSALGGGLQTAATGETTDAEAADADEQPEGGPIYYDLENERFDFWHRQKERPATWLPLGILLDNYLVSDFEQRLPQHPDRRKWFNRVRHLVGRFTDYVVPVIPLVTEDLNVAVQTYVRINRSGTRMGEVDLMNALTWSKDYDLNNRIEETRGQVAQRGWDLEPDLILMAFRTVMGIDIHKSDARAQRDRLLQEPDIAPRVSAALVETIEFLEQDCGVYDQGLLPNKYQLILPAELFSRGEVDPDTRTYLKRWFWATTFGESFASVHNARLLKMREVMARRAEPLLEALQLDAPIRAVAVRTFDLRAPRMKALALIQLRDLRPRALDGKPVPPAELARLGTSAFAEIFGRKELQASDSEQARLLASPANRMLVRPTEARDLRRALLAASERLTPEIQRSHGISPTAWAHLAQGTKEGWWKFLGQRRAELVGLENAALREAGLTPSSAKLTSKTRETV